jgi:hypothetical protein
MRPAGRQGVVVRTDAYMRYAVTYRSGDLTISGVMNRPEGTGPFPVVVLARSLTERE